MQQNAAAVEWPCCLQFYCKPMQMHTFIHNVVWGLDPKLSAQSVYQLLLLFHKLSRAIPNAKPLQQSIKDDKKNLQLTLAFSFSQKERKEMAERIH